MKMRKTMHSSDPGVHRKEVKKKNDDKWTPEERVIAPIFEKTDSLTGGLLHLNDDSILREADQGDDRTHERLAVIRNKLEVKKEKNRSLLSLLSTRPVLEPPCFGNFNNPLVLNRNLTPRANVGFSTSIPRPLNNSMETYLTESEDCVQSEGTSRTLHSSCVPRIEMLHQLTLQPCSQQGFLSGSPGLLGGNWTLKVAQMQLELARSITRELTKDPYLCHPAALKS
ncbi:putative coiled-coil domain-containing protein 144C isoform X2 [Bubalus kerabau]|uniref:putative coiled-coil domain-containing protein 144C isoform X2 n=1 Tax=Bubalus carabanensis TaxID=3119969 RepID=UPI00244E6AA7|nr:putative coiled-coil domain-containing protein 144C isoform X2 [Bubalus carabanensis]